MNTKAKAAKPEYTEAYLNGIAGILEAAKKERFRAAAVQIELTKTAVWTMQPIGEAARGRIISRLVPPLAEYLDVQPGFKYQKPEDLAANAVDRWTLEWYADQAKQEGKAARKKRRA